LIQPSAFPQKPNARDSRRDQSGAKTAPHKKAEIYTFSSTVLLYGLLTHRYYEAYGRTWRTQNPPTLAVMGVRPPLPAPLLSIHGINSLAIAAIFPAIFCAQSVPTLCPNFPPPASKPGPFPVQK
jgi:hypothetical protein